MFGHSGKKSGIFPEKRENPGNPGKILAPCARNYRGFPVFIILVKTGCVEISRTRRPDFSPKSEVLSIPRFRENLGIDIIN